MGYVEATTEKCGQEEHDCSFAAMSLTSAICVYFLVLRPRGGERDGIEDLTPFSGLHLLTLSFI